MKNSFFEKSTWKWIFAWLAVCWIFFLGAFAANLTSLDDFLIKQPPHLLTLSNWNWLIWSINGSFSGMNATMEKYTIPAWATMIFPWSSCPKWWSQWGWWWEKTFLVPLQEGQSLWGWWSNTISITLEHMPKHSHYVLSSDRPGTEGLGKVTALSIGDIDKVNNWDFDYLLAWVSSTPDVWKSSEVWEGKPITIVPKFVSVLFCQKD